MSKISAQDNHATGDPEPVAPPKPEDNHATGDPTTQDNHATGTPKPQDNHATSDGIS
jgi:hypothetical protein